MSGGQRYSLPASGDFCRPKGSKEASAGFPQLSSLNTCSGPPVSIWVHWLPSRPTELSFPGGWLGSPPISMLPNWCSSTAKFRNQCPHSLVEILLGWGRSSGVWGAVRGPGTELLPLVPALNFHDSTASPQRHRTWATSLSSTVTFTPCKTPRISFSSPMAASTDFR